MSIINEALKKAGRGNNTTPANKEELPIKSGFRPELLAKNKKVNWGPIFVVLVLVLITGPIVAPVFSTPFGGRPSTSIPQVSVGNSLQTGSERAFSENQRGQFGIEEMPLHPSIPPPFARNPQFMLNGIVFSSAESYCLINGKVIKLGEEVDGARLVNVTSDSATLDYRGDEIFLPVGN